MSIMASVVGIAALAGTGGTAAKSSMPHDVFGVWRTRGGEVLVEVFPDDQGAACGQIVAVDEEFSPAPRPADERPARPMPAADTGARTETMTPPEVGLPVLFGFEKGKVRWQGGFVFDTRSGEAYRARLERTDEQSLAVTGCLGPFCRTQEWTLVAAEIDGASGRPCGTPFAQKTG